MTRPTPEQIDQARQRLAAELVGWYLKALCDGQDSTAGDSMSWYVYSHLDGRQATVSEGGKATDSELQALLVKRRK